MVPIAQPNITEAEKQAVLQVMDSGMIACGDVVREFEQQFAAYSGCQYGIATTSGTTALEVALRALGVGPGDEVITTAYSFIASTNCILFVGARPVFVDIEAGGFNMDLDALEETLKAHPAAKAILVVHLFGLPCDMARVMALAGRYGVKVVEDCAQAHGAEWNGQRAGSFGDASAFSFYPTKNMTTGEGGIVLTNRADLADAARLLINHGMRVRYTHERVGYNYRMTNIAAAIGVEQLKKLDGFNAARRAHAAVYNQQVKNPLLVPPACPPGAKHVYHQYTLRVLNGRRADLIAHLEAAGVGYGIFYPKSIPEQPCYQPYNFPAAWPVTDEVKRQVLSIPVHPGLSAEEVQTVAAALNSFA